MVDKRLLKEARSQRILFVLSVAFSLAASAAILWQTWMVAKIVDGMFLGHATAATLKGSFVLALLALGLRIAFDCAEDYCSLKLATTIKMDLRGRILDKLGVLSPVQAAECQSGGLLNLLYDGVDTLETYFSGYLPQLFKAVFIPVLFLAVVFPKDPLSAVVMLLSLIHI